MATSSARPGQPTGGGGPPEDHPDLGIKTAVLSLLDKLGEGVVVADGPKLVYVNDGLCELAGRPREELLALPSFLPIVAPRDRAWVGELTERMTTVAQTEARAETWILMPDGTERPVEFSAAVVEAEDRQLVLALVRDASARAAERATLEEVQHELARRAAELQRSNRDLADFAAVASHDLREPLRVVSGFAGLLNNRHREQLDADGQELLDHVLGGTKRMDALVSRLLLYARAETETIAEEDIDANEALDEALTNLSRTIDERHASVRAHGLPRVRGDRTQLVRILQNLLGNAIKFSGSTTPSVEVSARRDGAFWEFSVKDDGPGIPLDQAADVFAPFRRLHGASVEGTGLGLAICKRLVERQGGRIWVHPGSDAGADVRFTLEAAEPEGLEQPDDVVDTPAPAPARSRRGPPWTVLLADDVAELRRLVRFVLAEDERFRVVAEAGDGEQALEQAERHKPDIILLDISMPKLDGLEVLDLLPARSPDSLVLVLSGFTNDRMGETARKLGAVRYLEKGMDPGHLLQEIIQVAESRRGATA